MGDVPREEGSRVAHEGSAVERDRDEAATTGRRRVVVDRRESIIVIRFVLRCGYTNYILNEGAV